MNNLIIIGNGFDLAHNLKTSYNHFINYILNTETNNSNLFPELYSYNGQPKELNYFIKIYFRNQAVGMGGGNQIFKFHNAFFEQIIRQTHSNNWCDIEALYFQLLKSTKDPKKLNDEFEVVKTHLKNYLKEEQKKFVQIPSYSSMFSAFNNTVKTLVLNFNYTNCIQNYCNNLNNIKVLNIHGELDNNANPIIFGYAAKHEDSRELSNKNNNEYLRNIKKHCYKRTNYFDQLVEYLNTVEEIDVSIFGHSCGLSDSLIINEVFNHKNISSIRIFYYKEHEPYFQSQINIDRIMNDDKNFKKLINFQDSHSMPQFDINSNDRVSFDKYILDLINRQKKSKNHFAVA